jgi:hypothetical protein
MHVTAYREMSTQAFDQLPRSARLVTQKFGVIMELRDGTTSAIGLSVFDDFATFVEASDLMPNVVKMIPVKLHD